MENFEFSNMSRYVNTICKHCTFFTVEVGEIKELSDILGKTILN